MRRTNFIAIAAIALASCSANQGAKPSGADSTTPMQADTATQSSATTEPEKELAQWAYEERADKMDGTKSKFATLMSTTDAEFGFPYGHSSFQLTVRKKGGSTDVYVYCNSCQFLTGISGDKTYRVKFDEEAPFNVTVMGAESGDSKMAFLGSEQKLIAKMKKAKKLMVEGQFYQEGRKAIEFDISGFQW